VTNGIRGLFCIRLNTQIGHIHAKFTSLRQRNISDDKYNRAYFSYIQQRRSLRRAELVGSKQPGG